MRIMIMDAQGGGIGKAIIEQLKTVLIVFDMWSLVEIIAVGTNAVATSNMLKLNAASGGATGENAVIWNAKRSDIIIGPIGIFFAGAMMGEITDNMAIALSESSAKKIAIPINKCQIQVVGLDNRPLSKYLEEVGTLVVELLKKSDL